jgi:hypothetical protein
MVHVAFVPPVGCFPMESGKVQPLDLKLTCELLRAIDASTSPRRAHRHCSASTAAAIPVHATLATNIRFRRFCYTLLGAGFGALEVKGEGEGASLTLFSI